MEEGKGRFPGSLVGVLNIGNTGERSSFSFVSFWEAERVLMIVQLGIVSIWLTIDIFVWAGWDEIA